MASTSSDGFPALVLTVIFGLYALGVVVGLWLFGHLSDTVGRRPMILIGLAAQLPALVISIAWPEPVGLSIGRILSGLGAAALTSPFTAQIGELRAAAVPRMSDSALSGTLTVTNLGGLGLGPLIGGLPAQFAPEPLVLPYMVFAVLLIAAIIAEFLVPETVAGQLHQTSVLLGGIVTFSVFAAATVAQTVLARLRERDRLAIALPAMLGGLTLLAIAVWGSSLIAFLIGGIILGAGAGLVFSIALGSSARIAPHGRESAVLGAIFLAAYAGLALPAIVVGVALEYLSPSVTLTGFAVVMAALTIVAITALARSEKASARGLSLAQA